MLDIEQLPPSDPYSYSKKTSSVSRGLIILASLHGWVLYDNHSCFQSSAKNNCFGFAFNYAP